VSCCKYLPEPDDSLVLEAAHAIYSKLGRTQDALRVALQVGSSGYLQPMVHIQRAMW
jgi:hypothetical protein